MNRVHEVVVVGLGAAGSSVLHQLARRGVDVAGIDRFAPPHAHGSSHGETRITRQAIGEGEAYVPLALRSNLIWEALERETGERLLERCGFLYLSRDDAGTSHHGKVGFMERTRKAAVRFGIAHEVLDARGIASRFPQFIGLAGDERAYYEPGGGYLRPERCIDVQLSVARGLGATIRTGCTLHSIDRSRPDVVLSTSDGDITAKKVVLATGSWLPRHASAKTAARVTVHRQVLHWFDLIDATAYRDGAQPTFIRTHGPDARDQFYGFPPIDGSIKVACENYEGAFDPDVPRDADPADGHAMAAEHVRGRVAGVAGAPSRSEACHYAVTDDQDFIVDHDDDDRIWFMSACSGHGFKHAAALGEAVAQAVASETVAIDLAPFSAARFAARS